MKVTNWRRKLAASLVAGGLMAPSALHAANLNSNLVANGDFESVSFGTIGDYGSPNVLNWSGDPGFAYSHDGSSGVPDYADGANPSGAGSWYFSTNNNPAEVDFSEPDLFYQDVNVSTGATATQIASGEAGYRMQAWMSSYLNDNDFGNVRLDFKDSVGGSLGFALVSDSDPGPDNVWSLNAGKGLVPSGTASVRVSLFGTRVGGGPGADGYIDNVDVQLTQASNVVVFLEVNTTNGQMTVKNQTGEAVNIDYYEVTSSSNALNPTAWNSLQDQNRAGFPAGNGSGNGWEQAGGSDAGVLSESYLTGNSAVPTSPTEGIGLGAGFNIGGTHDLVFRYGASIGTPAPVDGDYNNNGIVDAADYTRWRDTLGQSVTLPNDSTPGTVTPEDYAVWKQNFGATGALGPSTLVTGFVRYVSAGAGAASAVPEPASVILIGVGLASLAVVRRRSDRDPS